MPDKILICTSSMVYETLRYNTGFTKAELTQYLVKITISKISILLLSSHLRLGLPKGLFPVRLPIKILKELLLSSILAS
jgi:hypothetical protein